ncbi:MAG TPA: peptidylprolyl isomerase [Minicystis sp.]|nr:peptidylprolyl isomerase [Minicystis sp.]
MTRHALFGFGFAVLLVPVLAACGGDAGSGGGSGTTTTSSGSGGGAGGSGGAPCGADPPGMDQVLDATSDPEHGHFTMDQALDGLPDGPGPLRAIIDTDLGTLTCTLRPDVAPIGVANFVGLARGKRPWLDPTTKKWVLRRFYDGLLFHRVIPKFVAQGGDPLGTGYGGPGYAFGNEIGDLHHVPGTLAYANSGPGTISNGSQFYVTETKQPSLDGGYTIFGLCSPVSVVSKLTHVPTDTSTNTCTGTCLDRPVTPLHMKTITITRCAP